jgi:hypothetical protein
MDSFDYSDESLQTNRDSSSDIWNILTVIVLLMTLCVCLGVGLLLINPQNALNPFPPPTMPAEAEFPTATPTPKSVLPPTWTPAPTILPTETTSPTDTLVPTNTTVPTNTAPPTDPAASPTSEVPSETPGEGTPTATPETQATATPTEGMPFVLHPGDPVAINNIAYPELGCNWMGVGGRAFDLSGAAIEEGLFVKLEGTLSDEPVEMLGMIGMVDNYGPGSYEFVLGEEPLDSTQTLWVQLFDQAMLPLSEQILFDTFADCDRNLILINFNQVR